jgi:hypothetical protein
VRIEAGKSIAFRMFEELVVGERFTTMNGQQEFIKCSDEQHAFCLDTNEVVPLAPGTVVAPPHGERARKEVTVEELQPGDCFEFNNKAYIMISRSSRVIRGLNLRYGKYHDFAVGERVMPKPDAVVYLEGKV